MYGSRIKVNRYEDTIRAYESRPIEEEKGKILFYGHSLFTRCSWNTLAGKPNPKLADEVRMKDGSLAIVNHGFGTSNADELLYFYDRMVRAYEPRVLVLATSNNDFGNAYSAKEVMEIQARIIDWAQADMPGIEVYCFGSTPTVKHKGEKNAMTRLRDEYNQLLEDYCGRKENVTYVSLIDQPFYFENPEDVGDYDKVREDIFVADRTHLNPEGYAMFHNFIRELLDEYL